MRIVNVGGRTSLLAGDGIVDVERASGGRLSPKPERMFEQWTQLSELSERASPDTWIGRDLGPPVPTPRQVFAIGLNYAAHAAESGFERPELPPTFTKFPSCIAGPNDEIRLPSANVDWEVELVAVVGRPAHQVNAEDAWSYVAGLTVGQDISERVVQLRPPAAQFSLGKSFPRFGPIGPTLVTVDEFSDPDDLELGCSVNGKVMQRSRTSQMILTVPELIESISRIVTLWPGDLIFTGTPDGVGFARDPQQFLAHGDWLVSWVEGIGELRNTFSNY